jgi:hypothetical protein
VRAVPVRRDFLQKADGGEFADATIAGRDGYIERFAEVSY